MMGDGTRGVRGARDEGRGLPYRFVGDDWFGGWSAAGGFTIQAQGTEGDDVVTGTDADERYLGLGGNDTISGAGGRDHLFGNDGSDTIDGGRGNDVIFGGDKESGSAGQDTIHGGAGNDDIKSDSDGGDVIYGGKGNDNISTADNNVLYGGGGDDVIDGGNSDVFGGAGDDQLLGAQGKMKGGAGNDRLQIGFPFVPSEHGQEAWGGSGADDFLFEMPSGYIGGGQYVIHDLTNEDTIDLSGIDSRLGLPGDQAFTLVPEFDGQPGTMTVTYDAARDRTLIELHTDPNDIVDGTIVVPGDHTDFSNFVF